MKHKINPSRQMLRTFSSKFIRQEEIHTRRESAYELFQELEALFKEYSLPGYIEGSGYEPLWFLSYSKRNRKTEYASLLINRNGTIEYGRNYEPDKVPMIAFDRADGKWHYSGENEDWSATDELVRCILEELNNITSDL